MADETRHELTKLLRQTADVREIVAIVYPELRAVARNQLAQERPGHTLQPTALVNEVYLRLFGVDRVQYNDRAHFFCRRGAGNAADSR